MSLVVNEMTNQGVSTHACFCLTAVFAIVTAVIFGSEVTKYTNLSLSWSFAFDIMGGILFAVSGACCFVQYCCHT